MTETKLNLQLLPAIYGVCKLSPNDSIPKWATASTFYSITKTSEELSIVCLQENIPSSIQCEKDWRILKIKGPLDFSLIGILSSLSNLMALNQISIFALSTYDTDYILIKQKDIDNAIQMLRNNEYIVE